MGGIVSRTIFTVDNYVPGSVNTILTVATPHMIPPVALDHDITAIYDRIEMFWREGYQSPHSALANVSLVSIMGGNLDITVNSDAGNIHHIVVTAIGRALVDIVDARVPEQVKPLGQRMKAFRGRLLTGLEDHLHDRPDYERLSNITLANVPHTYVEPGDLWTYPPAQGHPDFDLKSTKSHVFIMEIPKAREQDTLAIVTNHKLGDRSRLDVLICRETASKHLSCERELLGAVPIPASAETSTMPLFTGEYFTNREFRFVSKKLGALTGAQYLVIVDRGAAFLDPGFLVAQFMNEDTSIDTVETTTTGELTRQFAPMMKQSSWAMHEDKYSVNIAGKAAGVDINFHGDLPYFDKIQLGGNRGVELRFWMDPTCREPLQLVLQVDKYGSLGKVVIRYRMVVLVFTFMVVVLVLRAQCEHWARFNVYKSFESTLARLTGSTFWRFSILLGLLSALQALKSKSAINLHGAEYMENIAHMDSYSVLRRVITLGICFVLVATVVPYQFAFAAAVLVLISSSARALAVAQRAPAASAQAAWGVYHFTMSLLVMFFFLLPFCVPALMVWIRNFAGGWFESFETDHRVLYVAPFIVLVEGVSNGALPLASRFLRTTYGCSMVAVAILDAMMVYLVLFGVRYSWQIYFMSRLLAGWLVTEFSFRSPAKPKKTVLPVPSTFPD
ncbi:GPI inositol deacylase [Mortierella alpina]|nr:GPI inositol deacylase [Mortierella alpina]